MYFDNINRILGEHFPVLGADGNHDEWAHYQPFFQARLERMGLKRTLIAGDEYGLRFGGIQWAVLGEQGNAAFVRTQFAHADDAWRVCMWHKNMHDMQTGDKEDDMDWATYRACQEAGALIVTGNEHAYARTVTLTDVGNRAAGHGATGPADRLEVGDEHDSCNFPDGASMGLTYQWLLTRNISSSVCRDVERSAKSTLIRTTLKEPQKPW